MSLLILQMNKSDANISTFKKSIESTVKAISKRSNINILFGSDTKNSDQNVSLPEINKKNLIKANWALEGKVTLYH